MAKQTRANAMDLITRDISVKSLMLIHYTVSSGLTIDDTTIHQLLLHNTSPIPIAHILSQELPGVGDVLTTLPGFTEQQKAGSYLASLFGYFNQSKSESVSPTGTHHKCAPYKTFHSNVLTETVMVPSNTTKLAIKKCACLHKMAEQNRHPSKYPKQFTCPNKQFTQTTRTKLNTVSVDTLRIMAAHFVTSLFERKSTQSCNHYSVPTNADIDNDAKHTEAGLIVHYSVNTACTSAIVEDTIAEEQSVNKPQLVFINRSEVHTIEGRVIVQVPHGKRGIYRS